MFNDLGFTFFLVNIRSANNPVKKALLAADLEKFTPDILGLNETWLDSSTESLDFPGYCCVSRRDRPNATVGKLNHGGIALYRRIGGVSVTHLENSTVAERSWHVVHTDVGGILLGLWYRPPGSDHSHITTLDAELERLSEGMIGTLLIGDINVWHKSWLKHSPCDTLEGESLRNICKQHDLKQLVKEPTRGPNLLDLVLSSLNGHAVANVVPAIADHKGVLVATDLPAPKETFFERTVWDFKHADWESLNKTFVSSCFAEDLRNLDVDDGTVYFTEKVLEMAKQFIPTRRIREHKGSHPWLNASCREAIARKHEAEGSENYMQVCEDCTQVLKTAYSDYVAKLRKDLKALPKGSKRWWTLSKALMDCSGVRSGIPSLRKASGEWVHDGAGKAQLFVDAFTSKFELPEDIEADATLDQPPSTFMSSFVLVRERWLRKELSKLREDQATGPDELPARILRNCSRSLSRFATILVRKMVAEHRWPLLWKSHRICPLFKKGAVHKPGNYRGLHLTAVLSKVAERVLNATFGKFIEAVDAFGESQWAFRKKRGCPDLVLLLMCSWLRSFQRREKVGVFLSDISGAFDRVDANKMIKKLRRAGVCETLVQFFIDYLSPRRAHVVVDGASSSAFELRDMLFQGTVFGTSLWNIFFADVHAPAEKYGGREQRFADDLSTSKAYPRKTPNDDILKDMCECQESVHAWGVVNRVSFDASKEEFAILGAQDGHGGPFRLLGPVVDQKLLMNDCVDKLYRKAKPKARALLRCARFFNVSDLLLLFKAHVRSQIEWCNGAIYHVARSKLAWLDSVQVSFLRHIGFDERVAFAHFNLAPLQTRRDVGMLGVLWKISRGLAHADLVELFPRAPHNKSRMSTRVHARRHNMQLVDFCDGSQLAQFARSLFGLVKVWNALPQEFVECKTVKCFQSKLTKAVKRACVDNCDEWQRMYSVDGLPFTLLTRYCF